MTSIAKTIWHVFLLGTLAFFSSCGVVKYVAVNNYGPPQIITVKHNPNIETLWESDTLFAGYINDEDFDTFLIRTNLDSATYWFLAPDSSHIELMPKAWENPIQQVKVTNGSEVLVIDLTNKEQLKKLKKKGIVETSGMPENMILINLNKPESAPEQAPVQREKGNISTKPDAGIEQAP